MKAIPDNLKGKELYDFLVSSKALIVAEKRATMKRADPFSAKYFMNEKGSAVKSLEQIGDDVSVIRTVNVINTTNWMDSHDDVHIPGLWKKTLSSPKPFYLLQEHEMTFKGIITDEVKAYTKMFGWRDLGVDMEGVTEALIFDSTIHKDRNTYMFNEYRKGRVKNHSVGMNYVWIEMAINDEDYKEEFAVWNKHIKSIANREVAEAKGYFFAVTEAKAIEGSAVPIGSNTITPTIHTEAAKSKTVTEEPPPGTTQESSFDLRAAIKETKFF